MHVQILLAEDNEDDVILFTRAIASAGFNYRVENTRTTQDTYDYLLGSGPYVDRLRFPFPDVLVLGLGDPFRTEFLAVLKRENRIPKLSVAVFSYTKLGTERDIALRLGACCFYEKPASFEKYQHVVRLMVTRCISILRKKSCCDD